MSAFKKQVDGGHYKDMAIQPTEYCQKNRLNFCESAVVKYVSRHQAKGGRKDIEKAIHFLEMLLEMEYPEQDVKHLRRKEDFWLSPAKMELVKNCGDSKECDDCKNNWNCQIPLPGTCGSLRK
jgi:hypothetical protein